MGAEYSSHLIDQLLKDVIGFGPYSIQVVERRLALCLAPVLIESPDADLMLV